VNFASRQWAIPEIIFGKAIVDQTEVPVSEYPLHSCYLSWGDCFAFFKLNIGKSGRDTTLFGKCFMCFML
jgi:hypothetical protein